MTDKQIQDRIMTYRILEARIDSILKQREMIANKMIEMQATIESMNEIQKSKDEILFPIGSEAYALGKVDQKEKIIMEIGADVALEKTFDEGKEILLKRQKELEGFMQNIENNISEISKTMERLQMEIQSLSAATEKQD